MPIAAPNSYLGRTGRPVYAGKPDPNYVPPAPGTSAGEPKFMRLYNWQFPSNPTFVGEIEFDTRAQDLVFTDPKIASEIGTVRVMQSSQSIVHPMLPDVKRDRFLNPILDGGGNQIPLDISRDDFEVGATVFAINGALNDEVPNEVVYQCLVAFTPHNRWADYPAEQNFDTTLDNTYPAAFKIELLNAARQVIHTYEMHDGWAINDPRNPNARLEYFPNDPTSGTGIRPLFTCGSMLPWQSARLKPSAHMNHWYPGFLESHYDPRDAKKRGTANAKMPLVYPFDQQSGMLQWYAMPEWPLPPDRTSTMGTTPLKALAPNTGDPYVFDASAYANQYGWTSGWKYEPGSVSGHDMFPGPGGVRFDRAIISTVHALYAMFPNGSRMLNNEPYRDMAHAYSLAYFNHAHHYIRNPKTFETIPNSQIVNREWSYRVGYYNGSSTNNYVAGGVARHIRLNSMVKDSSTALSNKNGRWTWNGWSVDFMHNYCQPAWAVMLQNSPMHLISAKLRLHAGVMTAMGSVDRSCFGYREQAWRLMHYGYLWACASNHPFGVSRADIEQMIVFDMHDVHDNWYLPTTVANPTNRFKCLRDLGIINTSIAAINATVDGVKQFRWPMVNPLWNYMGGVLAFWEQVGLLEVTFNKDAKCRIALEFIVQCLDKWNIDFILDCDARCEDGGPVPAHNYLTHWALTAETCVFPTSWADWNTMFPRIGLEDWTHNVDGTHRERASGTFLRVQYVHARRDYFNWINPNPPRLLAAIDKYQAHLDEWAANAPEPFVYRIPPHLPLKPSTP